jgi:hypothetical protein
MTLWACPPKPPHQNCIDITPANASPQGGSITYRVTASTEFWLQVFDASSLAADRSVFAWVGADHVTMSANRTQIAAGESTTLSWNVTGPGPATMDLSGLANVDWSAALPFIDLAGTGNPPPMGGGGDTAWYTVNFPSGFTFPWFGSNKTRLVATSDGYLSFNDGYATSDYSESRLPDSSTPELAIAAYWTDGEQNGPAQVLWQLFQTGSGQKYLVVEWKNYQLYNNDSSDLNYEVVLWDNGDVDLRYGRMYAPTQNDAWGNSAVIGYQGPALTEATSWMLTNGSVVPGGLTNRSFPVIRGVSGSLTVSPTESATYRVCAENASMYRACDEVRIVVVKPGDLLFSEAMIAPASPDAEWFELVNLAPDPIDLAGFQLASGTEVYPIPPGTPLVVQPGAYVVFARSADPAVNGGLTAPNVYGSALGLADVTDSLGLFMGPMPIDTVTWGAGWNIQANQSVALNPTLMARNPAANDAGTAWCPTVAVYGNGALGGSPGAAGTGCAAP